MATIGVLGPPLPRTLACSGLNWGFAEAVYVVTVDIYETFNPGSIVKVELIDTMGRWHVIWEGTGGRAATSGARVFSVKNDIVTVPCQRVRITLDTDSVSGWNEIDAVSITGSHSSPWPQAQGEADMELQWQVEPRPAVNTGRTAGLLSR